MREGNRRLITTIMISGTAAFLSYLINFFLTKYITASVGVEAFGFVSIAKTAVSYAQIVTVAFTTFVVRYISVSYHEGKMHEAKSYYTSSVFGCVAISGGIFAVALALIWKLEYLLVIPEDLILSVKLLFIFVFLNFVITTIIIPISAASYIKNRLDIAGILKIVSYFVDAGALLILFKLFFPSIWFVGVGSLAASCVWLIGNYSIKKKLLKDLSFDMKVFDLSKILSMLSNGIWQSINSLGNVLNSGLDLLISNLMLTGIETGEIAIAKQIGTIFSLLYSTISQPFQPQMLKSYASGDMNKFLRELTKAVKICGFFSNVAFAGFVAMGKLYFHLWLPEQNTNLLYALTILTVFTSITEGAVFPIFYVNTLTLKKKIPCLVTVGCGLLNAGSMYLLLSYTELGVYAIVLTTAVIMTISNFVFTPMYASKCLSISPWKIYSVLIRHVISVVIMCPVFIIIARIFNPQDWVGLIGTALLMTVAGSLIHGGIMGMIKPIISKFINR